MWDFVILTPVKDAYCSNSACTAGARSLNNTQQRKHMMSVTCTSVQQRQQKTTQAFIVFTMRQQNRNCMNKAP